MNSKWPDTLEGVHNIKLAFYLKVRELLQESEIKCNVDEDHLDVYWSGLVFRLRMYHSKELTLMKKFVRPDGVTAFKDNKESVQYELQLNVVPKIIGALNG